MSRLRTSMTWAILSQGVQSVQSLLVTVLAARYGDIDDFGAFGVSFVAITLGVGLTRTTLGDVLIVGRAATILPTYGEESGRTVYLASLLGAGCSTLAAVAILWSASPLQESLVVVLIGMPVWCAAEAYRSVLFGDGRARAVVACDVTFFLVQVLLLSVLWRLNWLSANWVLIAWLAGGLVACIAGWFASGVLPRYGGAWAWIAERRGLAGSFAADFLAGQGALQLLMGMAAAVIGLSGTASVRGAWALTGPLTAVIIGTGSAVLPAAVAARYEEDSLGDMLAVLRRGTVFLCLAVVAWSALLLGMPQQVGHSLLGESYSGAVAALGGVLLYVFVNCASMGPVWGYRVLGLGAKGARLRLMSGFLVVTCGLIGSLVGGAPGVGAGAAVGAAVMAPAWWWSFGRETKLWNAAH